MKEKTQIEKNAEEKQIALLSAALREASNAGGHWLNAAGKSYPKFYPKGVAVSPFNGLFMALHSDRNGCRTNLFTLFGDAKARGAAVREHEQGVPFLFYNWNEYVHRNNPEQRIGREAYLTLDEEERKQYKGVHNREIRTLFNIDQTTLPYVDKEGYEEAVRQDGSIVERGYTEADERRLRGRFNDFLTKMRDNLVPVRSDGSGMPHYETDRDAVYMPRQRDFEHYNDYVQEALRQVVSATGHQQRLAREGMVMKNGVAPSEDAVKQERLVVEVASGIKMLEMGLPARLSDESLGLADYWCRELKENPNLMDALESDVNNALEVIRKAEKGEKIEYATLRNRRQTSEMKEQMPKHYFVANEIRQHPSRKDKTIVIVIDPASKTADVILPAGASADVDNEIPGMNKARIGRALRKEGIEQVRFYNTDGALGYRPDDSYFAEKQVALARMKNWTMEMLSTLNVDEAVRRAHEVGFDRVQMIQDDKNRWALYLKPENRSGYSIYPDKEDVNRFFSTFKQAMDNIDKVRMELAHKYYALAETQPDLKVDLFGNRTRETDLNRIQRVSVFKTKTDGILCAATIDGTKVQPRSVTPQQWQRMWVAEDRDSYKRHLAATLFADVLRKGQTQEENTGEKQEKEHLQRQGEKATPKRTDDVVQESASPRNGLPIENLPEPLYGRYKEIKDELPEAIVLFKHEGSYYASMYDAETIANELNLPPQKERLAYDPDKMILAFEHDDEETRTQILSLRAFTIDCAAPGLQQETGEQNENEQHPTFRR